MILLPHVSVVTTLTIVGSVASIASLVYAWRKHKKGRVGGSRSRRRSQTHYEERSFTLFTYRSSRRRRK